MAGPAVVQVVALAVGQDLLDPCRPVAVPVAVLVAGQAVVQVVGREAVPEAASAAGRRGREPPAAVAGDRRQEAVVVARAVGR